MDAGASGTDSFELGPAQLCAGAGSGAGCVSAIGAAGLEAVRFFAGAFLALAFLAPAFLVLAFLALAFLADFGADFVAALAFLADFFAAFFADFLAAFLADFLTALFVDFLADFFDAFLLEVFFADFLAIRSCFFFLSFLSLFPLAIVIPPVAADQFVRSLFTGHYKSSASRRADR